MLKISLVPKEATFLVITIRISSGNLSISKDTVFSEKWKEGEIGETRLNTSEGTHIL